MEQRYQYEPYWAILDVSIVRAPDAGERLRPHHQSDFDHEPHFAARSDGIFGQQGRAAWFHKIIGFGIGPGRNHREWGQPRSRCHGNEHTDSSEPRVEPAIHFKAAGW